VCARRPPAGSLTRPPPLPPPRIARPHLLPVRAEPAARLALEEHFAAAKLPREAPLRARFLALLPLSLVILILIAALREPAGEKVDLVQDLYFALFHPPYHPPSLPSGTHLFTKAHSRLGKTAAMISLQMTIMT
jgi:hypothetical protein